MGELSDLERRLLSRLTDPKQMTLAWDKGLRADSFLEPVHQAIFVHMAAYWLTNHMEIVPTQIVLEHDFPGIPIPREVEEATGWLVDKIQEKHLQSQAREMMLHAAEAIQEDPWAALRILRDQADRLAEKVAPRVNRLNLADPVSINQRREWYGFRQREDGVGMTLGIEEIDAWTGGLLSGELASVVAYTKTGKTFFLVNAAVQARRAGYTPVIMSLEMSVRELADRCDAFLSGVSYDRLSKGHLNMDQIDTLREGQEMLTELGDLWVEQPSRGDRTASRMVNRARQLDADYLIIDQLSFMDSPNKHDTLKSKHSEIIFDLKDEIRDESAGPIPCLLAVQANRRSQERSGGQPKMENIANATEIEQTSDLLLGLWRDQAMLENNAMQVDIMGSRRSGLRSWQLGWDLVTQTRIECRRVVDGND